MKAPHKRLNPQKRIYTRSSSTTTYINYSKSRKILEVEFKDTGKAYQYFHVPQNVWNEYKQEIKSGGSSGKFYNKKIKPVYTEYEEIRE
jgi:hypothetical protein